VATEDTQVKETIPKDTEAIEAWLRMEKAPEPGSAKFDELIKDKSLPQGIDMKFHSLQSAGWAYVYHTKTGDKSIVNKNMLRMQLQKKLPDGSFAFSLLPPKDKNGNIIKPIVGTIKCMLHPDSPNRAHYDQMGFAVCMKDNIPNQHNLVQHMSHRHKMEYASMEKERTDAEKVEERAFQKALYTKMTESVQSVVAEPVKPQPVVVAEEAKPILDETYQRRVKQMAKARAAKKKSK